MEIKKESLLNIELKGEEADNFKNAIKKINAEQMKAGFNTSSLSDEEKKVIKDLGEKIK